MSGNYGGMIAFDGITWDFLGGNSTSNGVNNWVNALETYNGQLYAGGSFDQCGGSPPSPLNHIGVYSGPINLNENTIGDFSPAFPNPSHNKFEVSFDKNISYVKVIDISGQTIFESKNPSTINSIDLSAFPNGIYFISVQSDSNLRREYKLIKN